tara:strand:- start:1685 stop:2344 length:660 start_codon:yes stop_codon:yes gene_type:complete
MRHIKGHLILDTGKTLWVLDTGAPSSFGSVDKLEINDRTYEVKSNYMGFDNEQLSDAIGEKVEGLIGGDILNNFESYWNLSSGTISFSRGNIENKGDIISIDFIMGVPILEINLRGISQNWFFDTGAVISYVAEQNQAWEVAVDEHDDFYPGYGKFNTEVFEDEITLGELTMKIKCGVLPSLLGMSLAVAGCTGILGLNALDQKSFIYAPRRKKLILNV